MRRIVVLICGVALFAGFGVGYWFGSAHRGESLLSSRAEAQEIATDVGKPVAGGRWHYVYTSDSNGRLFVWEVKQIIKGLPPSVSLVDAGDIR